MRFAPPPVTPPVELGWLLGAAFGPELPPAVGDRRALPELARSFDLAPRIVARHGASRVEDRLGGAAGELILAHRRAAAFELAGESTARRVAQIAQRHGLRLIFLKGYALRHLAPGPPGGRPSIDLDVLLPPADATRLRQLLVDDGWPAAAEPGNPQHLPPVQDPEGLPVDIHFRLRGVRVAGERWATADELLSADLCLPAPPARGAWIPSPALLAAHLAVHSLEQHGNRPGTYPLLRAVADIVDLSVATGAAASASEIEPLVRQDLAGTEIRALLELGRILSEGRLPTAGNAAEGGAETLLRHIAAGVLDDGYRQALTIDHTAGRLRQARRDGQLMRYIAGKLKAPAEPSDLHAEGAAGDSGSLRRRLLRPIQLATRFTLAAAARIRRKLDR